VTVLGFTQTRFFRTAIPPPDPATACGCAGALLALGCGGAAGCGSFGEAGGAVSVGVGAGVGVVLGFPGRGMRGKPPGNCADALCVPRQVKVNNAATTSRCFFILTLLLF
jgi:hypothetical protein